MFLADRRGPCRRRDGDAIGHREQEAASLPLVLLLVVLQALPRRPAPAVPAQAACRAASATPRREVEEEEGARPAVDEDGSVGQVRGVHERQGLRRGTLRGARARPPRRRAPSLPLSQHPR